MPRADMMGNRVGAFILCLSSLLFFASLLFVPVDPNQGPLGILSQTGWLFMVGLTLLPLGMLALYSSLSSTRGGRVALVALICQLVAVGPLQIFAGLDTFGLSTLRHHIFQLGEQNSETVRILSGMMAEIGSNASPLSFLGANLGVYTLAVIGFGVLDIGMIVAAVAIWRSGVLAKWACLLYVLGFVLFLVAMFTAPGSVIRIGTAVIGGFGGMWLAWSLWQYPR